MSASRSLRLVSALRQDSAALRQRSLAPAAPLRAPMRGYARPQLRPQRRGTALPAAVAEALADGWPGLMLRKFSSDADCGEAFGRTRQTGTNWRSGHCKPDGPAVLLAFILWPEDMAHLCAKAVA
jgi:hypothetical protein